MTQVTICNICGERIEANQYILIDGYRVHPECASQVISNHIYKTKIKNGEKKE